MKKEMLYLFLTSGLLAACSNEKGVHTQEDFIGEWYEIMPVNKNIIQGIKLEEKGTASSIGMATLKYHNWELYKDNNNDINIVLKGESIGNGITIDFIDTLKVISLKNDTLILGKNENYRIGYIKNKNKEEQKNVKYENVYSEVQKRNIKLFEDTKNIIRPIDTNNSTTDGYMVFSEDSSKVELFLSGNSIVLEKRIKKDGTFVWNVEDDDTYMVENQNKEWIITRRGKVVYSSSGTKNMINAEFIDTDNNIIKVSFFNQAGVAQITIDGTNHILYQYRTASGYGYSNPFIDIRGKGKNLTVTNLTTKKSGNFVEKEH